MPSSMADILYDIGLCHYSVSERPERKTINNPALISTVVSALFGTEKRNDNCQRRQQLNTNVSW